jgi:hypothetical protein
MRIYGAVCAVLLLCTGCKRGLLKSDEAPLKNNDASPVTRLHKQQSDRYQKLHAATKKDPRPRVSKEIDAEELSVIELVPVDHIWTTDVPVPLQAKNKKNHYRASADQYEAAYIVAQTESELTQFCLEQMEMHGWQCCWQMHGVESLLFFTKSTKQCAVSIRPYGKYKQELVILQQIVC